MREAEQIKKQKIITEKAILLDPKHIGSYHNLALIYQERGQIKEGLNLAKKVLKFEKSHPKINHLIGIMKSSTRLL